MHELGVVFHIIKDLEKVATENKVTKINKVTLQLGEVSSVIPHYLTSCWRWAADKNELLNHSELIIEKKEAITHCDSCNKDYPTINSGKTCPHCNSTNTWLIMGNEFMIKEIEAI